jgi:hypothetical protein
LTLLSSGNTWLIGPSSPKAATTAVAARSTGTSAATIAPKANRSTRSVTGIESCSARFRSLLLPALEPMPSSVAVKPPRPIARTAPSSGAASKPWVVVAPTSAECPSCETCSVVGPPIALRKSALARPTADRNAGSPTPNAPLCR